MVLEVVLVSSAWEGGLRMSKNVRFEILPLSRSLTGPGPPGQVQDLQEHLQDVQEQLQDHF